MKFSSTLVLALLASCACASMEPLPPPNAYPFPPESGLREAYDATVGVLRREQLTPTTFRYAVICAGVMVENYVLTAYHCVDEEAEKDLPVYVGFHSDLELGGSFRRRYDYLVAFGDEGDDIAVLKQGVVSHAPNNTYANAPLFEGLPYAGQAIVTLGHPARLMYTLGTGIVSHPDRNGELGGGDWFQINADVSPGNSGGPVFTRWGDVLGIVSSMAVSHGFPQNHLVGAVHTRVLVDAVQRVKP